MFFSNLRKQMRWILIVLVAMFGGSLLYVGGPGFFGGGSPEQEALARPVAEVNGTTITSAELQSVYRNNLALYRRLFGQVQPGQNDEIMYRSLDSLIRNRLMLEAARAQNVPVAEEDINEELQRIKDSFPSEDAYREQLRLVRITERDLRDMIRENLMVRNLEEAVRGQVEVGEEDIRRSYEAVRARHILVRPEAADGEEPDEAAWEAALQEALELREQLLAGADFAELARARSDDRASADQGGDVGFFNRDAPLVEPFKAAAFELAPGDVSGPVRTDFGYHLIQVVERREAEGEAFEEAKAELEERLRQERGEARFQEWLQERRNAARVVIHDARLRAYHQALEGDLEGALADYRQALDEDPFDPYLHVSLSSVLQGLGRTDEALAELETAVEKSARDPEILLVLGLAYWQAERPDDAARVLVEASERADWDANLQFTAARILEELGYEEEAAAADQRLQALLDEWQEQQASSGRIQFSEEDWRLPAAEADGDGAGGDGEGAGSAPAGAAGADGATGGAGSDRGDGAAGGEAGDGAADGGQPGSPGAGGANP